MANQKSKYVAGPNPGLQISQNSQTTTFPVLPHSGLKAFQQAAGSSGISKTAETQTWINEDGSQTDYRIGGEMSSNRNESDRFEKVEADVRDEELETSSPQSRLDNDEVSNQLVLWETPKQ